jgi:G3E family GTPase
MKKLPVTVLSEFLSAGKTSLLKDILHNKERWKVAVVVNDRSEMNIDANLIKAQNTLSCAKERLVEMSNDCICCGLREDLTIDVEKLAKENRFDYLLIESSRINEPIPVAQTFLFVNEEKNIDLFLLKASITKLNPVVKSITSILGKVSSSEILNTKLFNYKEAESSAV